MATKERFVEYLKTKGIGQTSFEESSGLSRGAISQKSGFSANSIEKIAIACPDLNIDWLITGNGSMLKSEQISSIQQRLEHFIEEEKIDLRDFCKIIELPKSQFHNLNGQISEFRLKKIIENYPQLNIEWLMAGNGKMLKPLSTAQSEEQNQYNTIETDPLIAREPQAYYKSNKIIDSNTNESQVEKGEDNEMIQLLIRTLKTYQKREDELVTKIEQLQAEIEKLKVERKK